MKRIIITVLSATALIGCAKSAPEPEDFEIVNQQLRTITDNDGAKLFSYLVTVKAGSQKLINKKRQLTKSEIKKLLKQENFVDSSSLKLDLEDKAALQLDAELKKKNYDDDLIYKDHPFKIKDKVFSSILCLANRKLKLIAGVLGKDSSNIQEWTDRFEKSLMEVMWNEDDRLFYDFDIVPIIFVLLVFSFFQHTFRKVNTND